MSCTTTHPWYDGHSTSISACRMWGKRSGFKSPRGSFTHIHLDYVRIEILSCKKKNLYVMCDFSMITQFRFRSLCDNRIRSRSVHFHFGWRVLPYCPWGERKTLRVWVRLLSMGQESAYQRGQYHANCEWMDPLTDLCGSVVSLW